MPKALPGKIHITTPSSGTAVDVDALNFLLLGESDYNDKDPDNQLPTASGPAAGFGGKSPVEWFNATYSTNLGKPQNIQELFQVLQRNHSNLVSKFLRQGAWKNLNLTVSKFMDMFERAIGFKVPVSKSFDHASLEEYAVHWKKLKDEFALNEINASNNSWSEPPVGVNAENLHVALLYPGVASYLKKVRGRLLNNSYAVRSPIAPGFYPGLARGGISFQITTQSGGNNLNSNYPIEMRGLGPLIASSMRGGSFSGLAIGTVNSPTIWRPLTDDSYIGDSLIVAVNKVKAKLKSLGVELDANVNTKIAGRLSDLRTAEQAAKNYRDKLNIVARMNSTGSGSGQVDVSGRTKNASGNFEINDNDVDKLVQDYNNSMASVVKNEGVVLKVLDQLGRVVAEHRL